MTAATNDDLTLRGRPLHDLGRHGQGLWLSYLRRHLVEGRELGRLIAEEAVSGVSFDLDVFSAALDSGEYAEQIEQARGVDTAPEAILESLLAADVVGAAQTLSRTLRDGPLHGWVAVDAPAHLESSSAAVVTWLQGLQDASGSRRLMVKLPATVAGLQVAENVVAAGHSVYLSDLFSLDHLRQGLEAQVRGLHLAVASGRDVSACRVAAAFNLVRIDVAVDEVLRASTSDDREGRDLAESLLGRTAIALGKLAGSAVREATADPRWAELESAGAQPPVLAWEGTRTMSPARRDVEYLEELIGPGTVAVVSRAGLSAFRDHGLAAGTLDRQLTDAREILDDLERVGVDLDSLANDLQAAAVAHRAERFAEVYVRLGRERSTVGNLTMQLGALEAAVDLEITRATELDVCRRLWERDPTLWRGGDEDPAAIRDRLGWLGLPEAMREEALPVVAYRRPRGDGTVVLLGMGGSSLGAETFRVAFGNRSFVVLDTTVPRGVASVASRVDLSTALFIVASKSGTTLETLAMADYFYARLAENEEQPGAHFVAITDPGTPLHEQSRRLGYERLWLTPPDVGGRFSALSSFGLVPMALMGVDVGRVLGSAARMAVVAGPDVPAARNPALRLGAVLAAGVAEGRNKLTLLTSTKLSGFADWIEQLVAESLGKDGQGVVPVSQEPIGGAEAYGGDRVFVQLRLAADARDDAQEEALAELATLGHPVLRLELADPHELGQELLRWELAVAIAGALRGINPFDEPDVRGAKQRTGALLQRFESGEPLEQRAPVAEDKQLQLYAAPDLDVGLASVSAGAGPEEWLRAHLTRARAGDYLCLQAFLAPEMGTWHALQGLRALARDRLGVATTVGWGPRFLHSTGQLHKGGEDQGLFLQLTAEDASDLVIPDRSYSFGVLARAQALGDFQALLDGSRRVLRVHLRGETEPGLAALVDAVQRAFGVTS